MIGQSIFSRELLCETRPDYVIQRAQRELYRQFDLIVSHLRSRLTSSEELQALYSQDEPPFHGFKKVCFEYFKLR